MGGTDVIASVKVISFSVDTFEEEALMSSLVHYLMVYLIAG